MLQHTISIYTYRSCAFGRPNASVTYSALLRWCNVGHGRQTHDKLLQPPNQLWQQDGAIE